MSKSTEEFVRRLAGALPALHPLLAEHLEDNFGTPLPHVFMERVAAEVKAGRVDPAALHPALEAEFGRDEDVDDVIAVSYVESMPFPGEPGAELVNTLGPKLAEELRNQRGSGEPGSD